MAIENDKDQRDLEVWEARQAGENFSAIHEKVASDEVLLAEYLDAAETEMTNTQIAIEGKDGFDRSPERITELENELDRARDAVNAAYKIIKETLAAKEMGAKLRVCPTKF